MTPTTEQHPEEHRGDGWIQTYTGRRFWPANPRARDVVIQDIAHALANICRFTGHVSEFYSVAQHSVAVSTHVPPEHALWGLLHDASEAYLCDIARPIKALPELQGYRFAERQVMDCVCEAFGIPYKEPASVREADARMLATEARELLLGGPQGWTPGAEPYQGQIHAMSPAVAKRAFLDRYFDLTLRGAS